MTRTAWAVFTGSYHQINNEPWATLVKPRHGEWVIVRYFRVKVTKKGKSSRGLVPLFWQTATHTFALAFDRKADAWCSCASALDAFGVQAVSANYGCKQ